MKKLFFLLLASALLLTACGGSQDASSTTQPVPEPTALSTNITTVSPDGTVQRMEQIYDENGILVQANHYSGSNLIVSYAVTCNEQGLPLKMADESFGTGVAMLYTYNDQGQTLRIETWLGESPFLIQSYAYGDDGTTSAYAEEDLRTGSLSETRFFYENGLQSAEEFYENGNLLYTWKYTYDQENRRISARLFDENGVEDGSREYAYAPEMNTVTTLDVQGKVLSVKQSYYDALGQLIKEVLTVDGQVTTTEYTHLPPKETE